MKNNYMIVHKDADTGYTNVYYAKDVEEVEDTLLDLEILNIRNKPIEHIEEDFNNRIKVVNLNSLSPATDFIQPRKICTSCGYGYMNSLVQCSVCGSKNYKR